MNPRITIPLLGIALTSLAHGEAQTKASSQSHPNILVVLTDDIGWGDLRCYNPDGKIPTPAFDSLAASGMRFTDAHAPCAVCAPSRYSMVTGNYPWRGRTTTGSWKFDGGTDLLPGQKTFAHLAREHGYLTGIFGKAGFGADLEKSSDGKIDWSKPLVNGPGQWGFDFSYILLSGHQAAPYFYFRNGKMVGDPGKVMDFPKPLAATSETDIRFGGPGLPDWDPRKVGETLLDAFDEFLDRPRNGPFSAYFNTAGAHGPHTPPGEIRGTPVRGMSGLNAQADMVIEADVTFGHLVESLNKRGLLDNTIIFLTSDNGGVPHKWSYEKNEEAADNGHDPVGGLRGGKSLVWEGGHRVPLIVRWGDGSRIKPGAVSDQLVGLQDIFATVAQLVGAPPDPTQGRDSVSLLPELFGMRPSKTPVRDRLIMSSDFRYNNALEKGEDPPSFALLADLPPTPLLPESLSKPAIARAFRDGNWSLKFDKEHRPTTLHDLTSDPAETRNRINDPALREKVRDMVSRYYEMLLMERTAP